jgi:phosphatidylethanolamine-binding protein (PEBP) family uncharacterized protein
MKSRIKRTQSKSRTKRARSRSRTKNTIKKRRQKGSSKAGSSKAGSSKAGSGPTLSIIYAKIGNYADKPHITLSNYNAPYLLTMLDPDAPAGTWTHYVAIINNGKDTKKEPYKYQPPSPPPGSGTHRYIFQAYVLPEAYELPEAALNSPLIGNDYYVQILKPFLQDKKKIGNEVVFTVDS